LHGRGGVYLSTNNGTSWTDSGIIISPDVGVFALAVSGTNLFAGTARAFSFHKQRTNWIQANTGLTGRTIHAFALSDNISLQEQTRVFISPQTTDELDCGYNG